MKTKFQDLFATGLLKFKRTIAKFNGSSVIYNLEPYRRIVASIRKTETSIVDLNLEQCRQANAKIKNTISTTGITDNILIEAFALASVVINKMMGIEIHDEQLLAAIALHEGKIVEMQTGEGKTLAAVLPAYLNALASPGVCVLTFNDYLAKRDAQWMQPLYAALDISVDWIGEGMTQEQRQQAYAGDVIYLTAKQYGFDYLRDSLCYRLHDQVRRDCHFVIVDEADSILIDEARIPLILASANDKQQSTLVLAKNVVQKLYAPFDIEMDEYARNISLTELGLRHVEKLLSIDNLYAEQHLSMVTAIGYALHAHYLLKSGVDYLVKKDEVILIDGFTGRMADKRRWPDGLHAAVEVKENIASQHSSRILSSITLQHLLQQPPKIAGMSGTCESSAEEFNHLYGLKTLIVPTHKRCIRVHHPDRIFLNDDAKFNALIHEIIAINKTGRPILVGTGSVNESKILAARLRDRKLRVSMLNAENDADEAEIVADAGRLSAITISTNMAGRGTDIKLGGADGHDFQRVKGLGGLYVMGTQRNESLRIDRQLCGRAGRQGDPGDSVFYTALTDPLLDQFKLKNLLPEKVYRNLQHRGDREIKLPLIHKKSDQVQRIIDGQNFEIRKTLTKYSDMLEQQHLLVWHQRQNMLTGKEGCELFQSGSPEKYKELSEQVDKSLLWEVCVKIMLYTLDNQWQLHIGDVADLQQTVRLRSLGGEVPFIAYQKQLTQWFSGFFDIVDQEALELFNQLQYCNGRFNLEALGVSAPSATWTYEVNDDLFDDMTNQLLNQRGFVSVAAVFVWPLLILKLLISRFQNRRRGK